MRWERFQRQEGLADSSSSGPGKRWGHTCNATKGGRFVYVFGGYGGDGEGCLTNQVHVFDVERQIWNEPVIRGVPPSPRDGHSCTTVGDDLFVFGGDDGRKHYLNDLHVLDTSSHTWKCIEVRGEGPDAREAHSATLDGRCILIFGGCGKVPGLDDEVFFNDLYILWTETITWGRASTTGMRPSARHGHTFSIWNKKFIVVGGEDFDGNYLSDVHLLDTDTFAWKQLKTSGQVLTPRAGHVTVAFMSSLFVFGGFDGSQNLYNDLYVLDLKTGVWSKIAMGEGPCARFSAAAVRLGPYMAGSFFLCGGCNKDLEPLDDIYYLHTDRVYQARVAQTLERLSLKKQMKLKCKEQREAVDQGKMVFKARVNESSPLGYTIETMIYGKENNKMRWERFQRQEGPSPGPGKRWGHTCNATKGGRFVYVFGGFGGDGCLTDQVHVFDVERQRWTEPMIRGVPPSPRDGHSCTTVGDNLFVFGGTDGKQYLNDLHVLDTSSHTWKCLEARGGPDTREAHSATFDGKYIIIFGGCGKVPGLDDEVLYDDLYILNTETITWGRASTTGTRPFARDGHTFSIWNKKIIVVGGEDFNGNSLSDVYILDTDTFAWKQLKTSGEALTPRAGHVTVVTESNLFVVGGFADSQNLYNDLFVLDLETCVWSKITTEDGPCARFSDAAVFLGPYKPGSFFFVGGCNTNLEPLDDIYYLHTDIGVYEAWLARNAEWERIKLNCKELKLAMEQGRVVFQARITESSPLGYAIEARIDGKVVRGVLFSNRHHTTEDPSSSRQRRLVVQGRVTESSPLGFTIETTIDGKVVRGVLLSNRHQSSGKRPAMPDADFDHRAKTQRTLSTDSAGGSSQQAGPVDPSDDANINIRRPLEAETVAVTSDDKDQNPCQLDMDTVNAEPSLLVLLDQVNVEPFRNEISTDVGAAAEAGTGGDLSPEKHDEGRVAAEDANGEQ